LIYILPGSARSITMSTSPDYRTFSDEEDVKQLEVNVPFAFESDPKDSDYRLVKRIKLIDGLFEERKTCKENCRFTPLDGVVFLDRNTRVLLKVKSIQTKPNYVCHDSWSSTFFVFSLNFLEVQSVKICKQVNIEASFNIVISPISVRSRYCSPERTVNLKDVSVAILGKKKFYFLVKPDVRWLRSLSDGPAFHVEVVIKVRHDPSSLIQDLSKLLNDKKFTDVKIVCDGEAFKCHKAILATRSDVFATMFEMSGSTEDQTGEVKIEDIDAKTMKSLIIYMYQNRVLEQDADMMDLLFAADKYNLADLVLLCEESIMKNISDETVLDIAVSSRLLPSQKVFEAAKKFIESRPIKSLKAGNDWKMFEKGNPKAAKEMTQKSSKKKTKK
jgi:hypothetical protein